MTDRTPTTTTNLDRYGNDALPWSRARDLFANQPVDKDTPFFLSTVRPDGRPHAAGSGALWFDGDLYFTSNAETRKARNLAANPNCTISGRLDGLDIVFEGVATRVSDPATLEQVAARYREGGWPAEVAGDAFTAPFSAPSAGPPPWQLYRLICHTAIGVATAEPYGATRWRFDG